MSFHDNHARIDPSLDRAVYKQLADLIRVQIENGEFVAGQRIPSQKDYVQEHYLSRDTVDRAIGVLRHEGLVVTDRSGSRVRRPADRTAVPLGEGCVFACIPTDPERRRYGIEQGVPVFVVMRGDAVEVYPADRVVIRGGLDQFPGSVEQVERDAAVRAVVGKLDDGPAVGMPVTRFIVQRLGLRVAGSPGCEE